MRVNELAKEFGLTGKELVGRLREMGIPVKSHASVLSDGDAKEARERLEQEFVPVSAASDGNKGEHLTKEQKKAAEKKTAEELARRAAVEKERAEREVERALRMGETAEVDAPMEDPGSAASESVESSAGSAEGTATAAPSPAKPIPVPAPVLDAGKSLYGGLVSQIESEKERVAREAADAEMRMRAEKLAREVAKKQAVAEALASKRERKVKPAVGGLDAAATAAAGATAATAATAAAGEQSLPVAEEQSTKDAPAKKASKRAMPTVAEQKPVFDSLLSQIRNEQERIKKTAVSPPATAASEAPVSRRGGRSAARGAASGPVEVPGETLLEVSSAPAGGKRAGRKKQKAARSFEAAPEFGAELTGEDRYAQMAVQAEKLQRDKVLAEARAAVEAASTEGEGRRKKRKEKREAEARERLEIEAIEKGLDPELVLDDSVIEVPQSATVSKFADLLGVPPNDIIKRLFLLGQVLTLTQSMSDDLIELIADDLGRKVRVVSPEEEYAVVYHDTEAQLKPRPPVVTVMGHVDHGKTSLLDAIRETTVTEREAGGITQHIGASVVDLDGRQVTFIDTPGHEAFTAMRARGAKLTDVVVLVVAADDGVMPQTVEAINHANAAGVPIVVAVNKIDKPGATPDRVRQELTEHGIIPEEWGGSNMFVDVSAKMRLHIDDLLETILLQADVLELRANPDTSASGFVIEAHLDKGRGPVATVLVQRGTLTPGNVLVAGTSHGRVRALIDPRGTSVDKALPADPVEVLGLSSVPTAGDEFRVFEDERDARKLAEERALRVRLAEQEASSHVSLDDLFARIEAGKMTDLNLVVKADVAGSIEALQGAFSKMDQSEVRINIIHSAVGGITETDVALASASDAIIIGFNVRPVGKTRQEAEKEKVDIRLYRVIYQAIEDINAARVGLLSPDIVEKDTGIAEVRETFKVPKVGTVAGCYVLEGEITRDDRVRIVREGTVIYEGSIESLRRFKENVKSVKNGYECGIGISGFQDIKVGDTIEGYATIEVERTE